MNRRLRTALAVTAVIGSGLLMTACGGGDESSASDSPAASSSQASPTASGGSDSGDSGTSKSTGGGSSSDKSATADGDSSGDKKGYGQSCGTNDISWSVSSEDQAGGYFLIKATAKSGITCVLPAELPVVAFGSDGTEAEPAEQSAGQPITLREGVTAYAGVNPKTTNGDTGKELDSLIVSVANDDPNPESLKVDSFVVDKPIVTSWHTSPTDAVPFSG
ncbi:MULTISPECIES: DUF4232 domain-containing protein [Streptomyces]|uniref:DUF4232 domain-containing protein n=1 Tax=Streptomyces koelreuteriae TaxID=2838015 RepID=A0ABX8FT00_9ACTN|nr:MULTISPECIES: DUF4232 domain-containing protein [Streptomyces]QWB24247.1 DUF4232 domain-containing protein [Streptomyces koelreuteriae]UUA07247.1 DUF4232 domain-containing protein [Streptomyces koelreuteriae]UUA14876.1 DUF4232 domain-containing protein [Streptomyces sp. CRCS-T-1]